MFSITLCFVMGYYLDAAVYSRYSPTMPSTVSLLVSHARGGTFQKNLHRLLGVTLGKVLPILVMAIVGGFSCSDPMRPYIHSFCILSFFFVFNYIYYSSLQWDYMACLVSGFGCYGLMQTCHVGLRRMVVYTNQYTEIGQVTTAIVVQLLAESILTKRGPRDLAVKNVKGLGKAFVGGF